MTNEQLAIQNAKYRKEGKEDQITGKQNAKLTAAFFSKFKVGTSDKTNCPVKDDDVIIAKYVSFDTLIRHNFKTEKQAEFLYPVTKMAETKSFHLRATTSTAYKAACSTEDCLPSDTKVAHLFSNVVKMDATVCGKETIKASANSEVKELLKSDEVTEITFDTVAGWFETSHTESGASKSCIVDQYSLMVEDEDPFVMQLGKCINMRDDSTPALTTDYDVITDATSFDDCKKKCSEKGTACKGIQYDYQSGTA